MLFQRANRHAGEPTSRRFLPPTRLRNCSAGATARARACSVACAPSAGVVRPAAGDADKFRLSLLFAASSPVRSIDPHAGRPCDADGGGTNRRSPPRSGISYPHMPANMPRPAPLRMRFNAGAGMVMGLARGPEKPGAGGGGSGRRCQAGEHVTDRRRRH